MLYTKSERTDLLTLTLNIKCFGSPYWVNNDWSFDLMFFLCCWNRSAWRRRRSCPKTWAKQPPSSSSFLKPLRSSWPKRETQWEHYRSTWKDRWDDINTLVSSNCFSTAVTNLYLTFCFSRGNMWSWRKEHPSERKFTADTTKTAKYALWLP